MIEPIHNKDNNNEKEDILILNRKKVLIPNDQIEEHRNINTVYINREQKR